jgi:hypothetical protein
VIGREERTNAEQAQYRFLFFSLTGPRHTPPFVNIIWFPGNVPGIMGEGKIDLSCSKASHVLKDLNDSQKEIVQAMVSTASRDSLVIAHGIHTLLHNGHLSRH